MVKWNSSVISVLFLITVGSVTSHRRHNHHPNSNCTQNVNPGQPLFLTPLIKLGKIAEARQQASVRLADFDELTSYSGYLTVNEQWQSNIFFWYFPAERQPQQAPIMIWLEGGPGASSLFSLLIENGPLVATKRRTIELRKYSWHKNFNLIYIDSPVGTGYSFTKNDAGYARTEEDVGRDLYETVNQLYKLFPQFANLKLYISGGSYAGKFVPALAYTIHSTRENLRKQGKQPPNDIKLTGLAIGNGFSDPITQINYGQNLYSLGLIDANGLREFQTKEAEIRECIRRNDVDCVIRIAETLTTNAAGEFDGTLLNNLTGYNYMFNFLQTEFPITNEFLTMMEYVQRPATRRSLHVGNNTFRHFDTEPIFNEKIRGDLIRSVAPWVEELLNYYEVCIFHGQMDLEIPYRPTVEYLEKLKFNGSDGYKTAKRNVWKVDEDVAGYVKKAGKLTEILIRNAGHLSTTDQPKWTFDLINRFVNGNF